MEWHELSRVKIIIGFNNIVPTHIILLSRDSAVFILSVSKSCRFYSQHVRITCRHNFDCHPDVGLLLSLVHFVVCWDCHVTSFARSIWVVCTISLHPTEINSIVLSKLNRYANQWSVYRLEMNEYWHRLCYKTAVTVVFAVRLHVLLAVFSSRFSISLRIHCAEQFVEIRTPSLSVNAAT